MLKLIRSSKGEIIMLLNLLKMLKLTVVRETNVIEVYKIKINTKIDNKKIRSNIHYFEKYKV
jgi:hypothetical protein